MPVYSQYYNCPVDGCPGGARGRSNMYRHFCLKHPNATINIVQDRPLQRCPRCLGFARNITAHQQTQRCKKGFARRIAEDQKNNMDNEKFVMKIKNNPIERVREFLYLGRWIFDSDDDTETINRQLRKTKIRWMKLSKILKRHDANPRIMGSFYQAIIQAVLLYGSESWVISNNNLKKLRSFHHRCARHMVGYHIRLDPTTNTWEHPPSKDVLKKCGLKPIESYIENRRCTLREYLVGGQWGGISNYRPIYRKCLDSSPLQSNINQLTWWEHKSFSVFDEDRFFR